MASRVRNDRPVLVAGELIATMASFHGLRGGSATRVNARHGGTATKPKQLLPEFLRHLSANTRAHGVFRLRNFRSQNSYLTTVMNSSCDVWLRTVGALP